MIETLFPDFDPTSLIGKALLLAIVVTVAIVVQKVSIRFSSKALEKAKVPQASILLNIQRGLIWGFALLFVLGPVFGIEPTGFVATLGVTSVALSLGLQDTVSNLIGGLTIMLSKIIQPGDYVTASGFTGVVTDINWRCTCLKDREGNEQVIPNSVLWKSPFTKLSEGAASSATVSMVVVRDANLAEVAQEAVVEATRAAAKLLDLTQEPLAQFSDISAGGVAMTLTLFMAPGVTSAAVVDVVSRALAEKPWLA